MNAIVYYNLNSLAAAARSAIGLASSSSSTTGSAPLSTFPADQDENTSMYNVTTTTLPSSDMTVVPMDASARGNGGMQTHLSLPSAPKSPLSSSRSVATHTPPLQRDRRVFNCALLTLVLSVAALTALCTLCVAPFVQKTLQVDDTFYTNCVCSLTPLVPVLHGKSGHLITLFPLTTAERHRVAVDVMASPETLVWLGDDIIMPIHALNISTLLPTAPTSSWRHVANKQMLHMYIFMNISFCGPVADSSLTGPTLYDVTPFYRIHAPFNITAGVADWQTIFTYASQWLTDEEYLADLMLLSHPAFTVIETATAAANMTVKQYYPYRPHHPANTQQMWRDNMTCHVDHHFYWSTLPHENSIWLQHPREAVMPAAYFILCIILCFHLTMILLAVGMFLQHTIQKSPYEKETDAALRAPPYDATTMYPSEI